MPRLTLAHRFMLASVFVLTCGMLGIGWWIGDQIDDGVIRQTASTTALYVDSVIAPRVQELADADALTPEHAALLSALLNETALGHQIVAFKVWGDGGRVVYSSNPLGIGQVFPVEGPLARAWRGEVASEISDLQHTENTLERGRWPRLLETYSPVRLIGTNRIIAVAEFYQTVDALEADIAQARRRSWLLIGGVTLVMYVLLAGFVQRASDTIDRQQQVLETQVRQLTAVLAQNEALHQRVQGAASRTAAINERFLRRVSAELHDGPAQALALALLRLDHLPLRRTAAVATAAASPTATVGATGGAIRQTAGTADGTDDLDGAALPPNGADDLEGLRAVLQAALREIRTISAGLALPQLSGLTLDQTVRRAVTAHEQRTRTRVSLRMGTLPAQAAMSLKITVYRLLQEALTNAQRHAAAVAQRVDVRYDAGLLDVSVSDGGPGFDATQIDAGTAGEQGEQGQHLGLVGMRERVESLGGRLRVESAPGNGTTITARLPVHAVDEALDRQPAMETDATPAADRAADGVHV